MRPSRPFGEPKPDDTLICRATRWNAGQRCRICDKRIREGQLLALTHHRTWLNHAGCLALIRRRKSNI